MTSTPLRAIVSRTCAASSTEPSTPTISGRGSSGRIASIELGDLVLDLVERRLRDIEQHDAARALLQELAHELGADGAAGAGDEDRLAARLARQQLGVGRNLVAAEQVVDLERAQIGDADAARGDVLDRRQHLHLDRLDPAAP